MAVPQSDAPKLPTTPLDALTPKPWDKEPFLLENYGVITGAAFGLLLPYFYNELMRRPSYAGIYFYPFSVALFGAAGHLLMKRQTDRLAERDAILRHYVSIHPEDFPPYKPRQIKEIFEEWVPIR